MVYGLEGIYTEWLDKIGLTYIVRAAMECLALPLSLDDLKGFLADVRGFVTGVVDILKIPTIFLDDLIPTVDILGDIIEQVFWAIYESVKKALLDMLKGIIFALLDACGDPCAANFGGVQIGALLQKGGLKDLGKGLAGPLAATVGSAAVGGIGNSLAEGNFDENSQKFLNNLNKKVSTEQMKALTQPASAAGGAIIRGTQNAISNSPIGKFFDEASSALTCGETNNLLRGKGSPAAQKIIQKIASQYPGVDNLLSDAASINDFFGQAGKFIDEDELAAQIDAAAEFFPNPTGCLTDKEDTELRCAILADREAPPEFCLDQVTTSHERALKRVMQLQELLDNPDALQDALPPIYCTYDPETGKIIDGLVPRDHPSFMFMMDTTLDTSFAGIYNAFTYDILRVPQAMKLEVPGGPNEILRVKPMPVHEGGMFITGRGVTTYGMNPEFELAVQQGYAPDPPYWKSGPWTDRRLGGDPQDGNDAVSETDPQLIAVYAENARARTIEWNYNIQSKTNPDGTPKFPFSIPTTQVVFCPGMSGSNGVYSNFQTGYTFVARPDLNLKARDRLNADEKQLEISVPNMIKTNLQTFGGSAGGGATLAEVLANKYPSMKNLFGPDRYVVALTSQRYDVLDKEKFSVKIIGDSSGEIAPGVSADAILYEKLFITDIPTSAQRILSERDLNPANLNPNSPLAQSTTSTKELQFVEYLQKVWYDGESIYAGVDQNNLEKLIGDQRPCLRRGLSNTLWYTSNFVQQGAQFPNGNDAALIMGSLLEDQSSTTEIRSLYEETLRDVTAACLTQVGGSRLLQGNGNIFDLIDFAPLPKIGCPDPNLLNLEFIKDFIKEQYKDALCLERSLPNTSGLGDNRDNAFESAALAGVVRATIRTYAIEIVIKTLVTFSRLEVDDLDEVFYAYLREQIVAEIRAKGYLSDFSAQALKAYNVIAADRDDLAYPETDAIIALDFFIEKEVCYAVRKLLQVSGLSSPEKSVNNLLINDSTNFLERGWLTEFEAREGMLPSPGQAASQNRIEATYHVDDIEDILGIKDFANGSLVLEKYIRVEPRNWGRRANGDPFDNLFHPYDWRGKAEKETGVFGVSNYWQHHWNGAADTIFDDDRFPLLPRPPPQPGTPGIDSVSTDFDIAGSEECDPVGSSLTITIPGTPAGPDVPVDVQENFGRYFKSFRYGLRLVCKVGGGGYSSVDPSPLQDLMSKTTQTLTDPPSIVAAFNEPPEDRRFNLEKARKNSSYLVSDEGQFPDGNFRGFRTPDAIPTRFAFPVVCIEFDEPNETEISDANTDMNFFIGKYNEKYPEMLAALKESDEYKFMFDYCFPLKRLISLCVLYNAVYVLPFPGLNNVFANTKEQLRLTFIAMLKSGNYQYKDPHFSNQNMAINIANGTDLELMGLDFSKMALQFIFGIFKGLGEAFSPNIALAKLIKDAMKMIGPGLISAVNKAKEVGNRANELASGDFDGDADGDGIPNRDDPDYQPAFEEIDCLPFDIPDLPMFLISLGLLPMDLFPFFPVGPPLTGLGMTYLPFFGFDMAPGNLIIGLSKEQKTSLRCKADPTRGGSGPALLNAGAINCPEDQAAAPVPPSNNTGRGALQGSVGAGDSGSPSETEPPSECDDPDFTS